MLLLFYYFLFCSCYLEVIEIKSKVALCLETVSHFGDMLICFSFFLLGLFLNGERGALGEEGEDIFFWEYLRTKLSDNLSLTDVVLLYMKCWAFSWWGGAASVGRRAYSLCWFGGFWSESSGRGAPGWRGVCARGPAGAARLYHDRAHYDDLHYRMNE